MLFDLYRLSFVELSSFVEIRSRDDFSCLPITFVSEEEASIISCSTFDCYFAMYSLHCYVSYGSRTGLEPATPATTTPCSAY